MLKKALAYDPARYTAFSEFIVSPFGFFGTMRLFRKEKID